MTDTFSWPVTSEANGDGTLNVSESKFGDGYVQSSPIGINNDQQKWTVTFVGERDEALEVLTWIRARKGNVSFYWTPPLGTQGYWRCKKYRPRNEGGTLFTLQLEFEQAFAP